MFLTRAEWKSRAAARATDTARLKASASEAWTLGPDDAVTVNEIACRDPGCPDRETVFLVMRPGEATRAIKIQKPMAEVTRSDLDGLLPQASP